jgi:hypothetical protein
MAKFYFFFLKRAFTQRACWLALLLFALCGFLCALLKIRLIPPLFIELLEVLLID